ncbi:uncharacterized protein Tco025E_06681 [Trypanosoma conorhini]|uniref:Uncharacterized protein n=1 Tax=Trypanosoma conorhini TaxID=83891 RepID=A0A422P099_9TRYP|nr:uncharacterized protein Tco025E_06681 [Trypanosoma conorhini]RNF11146.1 hypothetical protein Tco025E_06681 [Trypanosoma conorhini]
MMVHTSSYLGHLIVPPAKSTDVDAGERKPPSGHSCHASLPSCFTCTVPSPHRTRAHTPLTPSDSLPSGRCFTRSESPSRHHEPWPVSYPRRDVTLASEHLLRTKSLSVD